MDLISTLRDLFLNFSENFWRCKSYAKYPPASIIPYCHCKKHTTPPRPLWGFSEKTQKKRLDFCVSICYYQYVWVHLVLYPLRLLWETSEKTLRKDLTIRLWCDIIVNVRVREEKFPSGNEAAEDSQKIFLDIVIQMSYNVNRGWERNWESLSSPSLCHWVAGSGGLLNHCRTTGKELRFWYSRVVRFRPRDAFFSWHLTFDLILLLLNWLRNNPLMPMF